MMEICKGLPTRTTLTDPETGAPLGIVHRDISPPNMLISKQRRGEAGGLRPRQGDQSQLETTDPGVVKGKFSYLSPEAARGEEVDSRADIFAVGILLYELLTGKRSSTARPTTRPSSWCGSARSRRIGRRTREVEPELEEMVRKALARAPNERFQTRGRSAGRAGALPVLARPEGDPARHRASWCASAWTRQSRSRGRQEARQHHRHAAPRGDRQVHLGRLRGSGRAAAVSRQSVAFAGRVGCWARHMCRRRRLHRSARLGQRAE